jgi:NO-binding membrane sensor protein with MHYT domain
MRNLRQRVDKQAVAALRSTNSVVGEVIYTFHFTGMSAVLVHIFRGRDKE